MAITAEYTTASLRSYPSGAAGTSVTPHSSTWFMSNYFEIHPSTPEAWILAGLVVVAPSASEWEIKIATGAAGSETEICTFSGVTETGTVGGPNFHPLPIPIDNIASGARVAVRMRKNGTNISAWRVKLAYYKQSEFGANATKTTKPLLCHPSGASGVSVTPSATSWAWSAYSEVIASTTADWILGGLVINTGVAQPAEVEIATGAASSEVWKTTFRAEYDTAAGTSIPLAQITPLDALPSGSRISVRMRKNGTNVSSATFKLQYYEKPI